MNDRRTDDQTVESTDTERSARTEESATERRAPRESEAEDVPSSQPPDRDPQPSGSGPGPSADPGRGWATLAFALALVSLVTAGATAAIHELTVAATGAAVLGIAFAALGAVALTDGSGVAAGLSEGWAEHRLYVWFATALFGGGALLGAALVAAGIDLSELFLELLTEEFGEEEFVDDELAEGGGIELSATFFLVQNTPPFLAAIFGALTLGLVTTIIMVFNGIIVGNIAVVTGLEVGFGPIVALLAPHGIFELPALFIAAGVGFRFLHRAGQRLVGSRESLFTKAYVYRTTLLVAFGWLLLALAAFVEAYLTIVIAEALFPELAEP
ncbi:stage II sporulation protein M [Natronococcus occultus]|uniref:Putative membrane protein n=1 Tax=Natronococcus occultus SP4 TaxID=694430 RepID=L0JUJ6_9EURY|nr:stage II sporulation protein M [Natronococcus occultus]AGB35955.1 putative membrane protein [Natronococcus occultus SP4]